MKLDNVLVIGEANTDDEPLALRKALNLARAQPMSIHLLYVVYCETDEHTSLLNDTDRQSLKQTLLSQTREKVDAMVAREADEGADISVEVIWDADLIAVVERFCESRPIDLIIKTGHRSESLLHVPTDFHLLRSSRLPVMIRRTQRWACKPVVLARVEYLPDDADQMALNLKVLNAAAKLASLRGAELHCCHVIACSKVLMDLDFLQQDYLEDKFRKKHQQALTDYVREFAIEPGQLHVQAGPPDRVLPKVANKIKADLVVLGTHHKRGGEFFFGNNCEKLLSILRTDVMTVKSE